MLDVVAFRRALVIAAAAAGAAAMLLVAPGTEHAGRAVAVSFLAAAVAVGAAIVAVGRARAVRAPAWYFLAAALTTWSVGQVGRAAWALSHPALAMPFPHWSDAAFAFTAPLLIAGMLVQRTEVISVTRIRRVVEACIMALSMLFVGWALLLGSAFEQAGGGVPERLLAGWYLSGGVAAVSLAVSFLARLRSGRRTMGWLAAALMLMVATDWVYVYRSTAGEFHPGGGTDVAWAATSLLFLLGALSPRSSQRAERSVAPGGAMLALPLLPVLAVVGVAAWIAGQGRSLGPMLGTTALALSVLVLIRQYLTAIENRKLTQNLAERIDELSEREHELRHQAFHDSLTGLANRALFLDRVEHALTLRSHRRLALLFLDIDDFKLVNDSLGHGAGDELITVVGQRLRAVSRHGDTVARLGGDEFGILLEGLNRRQDAEAVAERVIESVKSPLTIAGVCLNTRVSIGVAHTEEARSAGELLRNADVALYAAKGEGKGSWKVFATAMQEEARDKLDLEAELARAVEAGEIDVAFQPMVRLDTGQLAGFEALARWRHDRRGAISPMTFIGLAEEMGLIHRLGVAVLRRACGQAREWGERYPDGPDWCMTVNLSARQLAQPGLVDEVVGILAETGLEAHRLVFEITETSLLSDAEVVLQRLHELRAHGVRLALDDFGTGYASLDYLRRLPVDILKIDRIFVDAASGDPASARLLQAVVNIGGTLGLQTLAEGVESSEQAALLSTMGCDLAQGFHIARPGTAAEVDAILARIAVNGWCFDLHEESRPAVVSHPVLLSPRGATA